MFLFYDFNNDGKQDMLLIQTFVTTQDYKPTLLLNSTQGTNISFAAPVTLPAAPGSSGLNLIIEDIDGDGLVDVSGTCNAIFNPPSNGKYVNIWQNIGTATNPLFAAPVVDTVGIFANSLAVDDIDGDGKLDLLTCDANDYQISIIRNFSNPGPVSTANLQAPVTLSTPNPCWRNRIADFDNDGKPDMAMVSTFNQIIIYRNSPPPLLSPSPLIVCENGLAKMFVASVHNPMSSYRWQQSVGNAPFSNLQQNSTFSGVYSDTLSINVVGGTLNGSVYRCITYPSGNVKYSKPDTLYAFSLPPFNITYLGGTLSAVAGYSNYQWYRNGVAIPGATADSFIPTLNGSYTVQVGNGEKCKYTSPAYELNKLGFTNAKNSNYQVYPNPATSFVQVDADGSLFLSVLDMTGRQVLPTSSSKRVDVSGLPAGFYLISLTNEKKGLREIHKVLIVR